MYLGFLFGRIFQKGRKFPIFTYSRKEGDMLILGILLIVAGIILVFFSINIVAYALIAAGVLVILFAGLSVRGQSMINARSSLDGKITIPRARAQDKNSAM